MENVEIRGKITSDASQAVKSTNDYIDALKAAKKAVNEAKIGSIEHKKAQEQLAVATKDLDQAVSKSGGSFGKLKETLGSTVPGFRGAQAGAEGLNTKMWELVKNPVGLIITAIVLSLTLLYKAFTSTNDGADKMEQIMSGLGAVMNVLRDRVLAIAGAIGKFFSGDFVAAMEQGKAAVSGIGQEIADEFSAASQATKTLQDLDDSFRALGVSRAKLNRDLAGAKEIMSDADASFDARRKAINEVRSAEIKQTDAELKAAKERWDAILLQNSLSDKSDEALQKAADAESAYYNLQAQSKQNIRSLNKLENNLNREEKSKADQAKKERQEKNDKEDKKKAEWKLANEKWNNEQLATSMADSVSFVIDEVNKGVDAKDAAGKKEVELASWKAGRIKFFSDQERDDAKKTLEHKKAIFNEVQGIIAKGVEIFGKQTIAGKGLAMAQALMNTYSGATDALRAKSVLPSPFDVVAKVANVAAVIATGFKSIRAIGAVQVPGGGGGSVPSMPTLSASAPLSPTQGSTALNAGSIQGIGNAANGGVSRSFILESDITNNRERAERINRASRLG